MVGLESADLRNSHLPDGKNRRRVDRRSNWPLEPFPRARHLIFNWGHHVYNVPANAF